MAIAYVTGSTNTSGGSYNTGGSLNVTVSGTAPFVIVAINTDPFGGARRSMSEITCGGNAMTLLGTIDYSTTGRFFVYYRANPSAGSNTITFTLDSSAQWRMAASVYSGVNGGNPINISGTSTNGTNTLTSTAANCWHVMGAGITDAFNGTVTAGTGTTRRDYLQSAGIFDNNAAVNPAGSNSIIVEGGTDNEATVGAMLAPASIFNLTDTITTTEAVSYLRKIVKSLTETITITQLQTIALTETITTSDTYIRLKRKWQNLAKNINSWTNQDKS